MIEFLLDTNIVSEAVKPQPNPLVLQRLQTSIGKIAIASITWHELLYGMRRLSDSKRKQDLERYLVDVVAATMTIIPYEILAADWFATERARLALIGKTLTIPDKDGDDVAHYLEKQLAALLNELKALREDQDS